MPLNYEGVKTVIRNGGSITDDGCEVMLLGALHNILDSEEDIQTRIKEIFMTLKAYEEVKAETSI